MGVHALVAEGLLEAGHHPCNEGTDGNGVRGGVSCSPGALVLPVGAAAAHANVQKRIAVGSIDIDYYLIFIVLVMLIHKIVPLIGPS